MKRTPIVLLALVVLLVTAPIVGIVGAQETNSTSTESDSDLTLDELEDDGPRIGNTDPGVRMGDEEMFWAIYWPSDAPFAEVGNPASSEPLPPGHTVRRNTIALRTWTFEDRDETVHVAYYEKGQRQVQRGNVTTTEYFAKNVTHVTHNVTFDRGNPTVEIPLQQHDEPVHMKIWIEGEDYARWANLQHHSSATTQTADISSQGEYLMSVIVDFLLLIVVGGFAVGWGTKKAVERAGVGPQYGYGPWILGLTVLTGLGSLLAYQSIADLLVNAKYLLSFYVVAVIGIVMLETFETNVSQALFQQATLDHATSPTGDDAFDILGMEATEERVVRNPDGTVSVVTPGLFPFLARVFGKSARLENVEQLRTRVPMKDSKWDELFLTDPESEEIIHYVQEGWEFDFPPLDHEHAPQYLLVAAGLVAAAGGLYLGMASPWVIVPLTVAGLVFWGLSPVDGIAGVDPAPVHLRTAFGTMVKYSEDVDDAKYLDEVKKKLDNERINRQRAVDEEVSEHDRTLVEGMHDPDGKIPASKVDDEDEDDVLANQSDSTTSRPADGGVADDD